MLKRKNASVFPGGSFFPDDSCNKILSPEDLIHDDLEVVGFVIVDGDPDASVFGEHFAEEFEAGIHHAQPMGVFQVVVVVLEGAAGVVGRVDEDALDAAGVEGQQRLEGLQIVALDEHVLGLLIAVGELGHGLQQAVGDAGGGAFIFGSGEPIELGHNRMKL